MNSPRISTHRRISRQPPWTREEVRADDRTIGTLDHNSDHDLYYVADHRWDPVGNARGYKDRDEALAVLVEAQTGQEATR